MAKLGQIKSGTMRVGNTTASGYGIVYADEIIGHRRVNTYADLANIPDWSLYNKAGGETTSACIRRRHDLHDIPRRRRIPLQNPRSRYSMCHCYKQQPGQDGIADQTTSCTTPTV